MAAEAFEAWNGVSGESPEWWWLVERFGVDLSRLAKQDQKFFKACPRALAWWTKSFRRWHR
jgi:phosphatidylserine decarboxylase